MSAKRKILIWFLSILLVVGIIFGVCAIYVSDYYSADGNATDAFFNASLSTVEVKENEEFTAFIPEEISAGFIFYPGGKVDHKAYYPLMHACAERGILSIVVSMPLRLAVLDVNAADSIKENYPEVTDWYIGGHSLGGSMAASYLSKNTDEFRGLILLGAYSTKNLSSAHIAALSVYGSEDEVMNKSKYDENLSNMPEDFTEIVIDGGCHAYFGMYGAQDGDGTPTVSNSEQIYITADEIWSFISKNLQNASS